ncbi:MAG: glycoside hydrolase, partial [Pseudomonadota bacterium]
PLTFHPADPKTLLYATNVLWRTRNGGQSWDIISPDLSREQPALPASIGDFKTVEMETMERLGVIYALGPSPLDRQLIWAGTDDGLLHVTRNGGRSWSNVTPPSLRPWDKVSNLDAGHFDEQTAYAAINAIRLDDMRPHILRTHDGGATWTEIVNGLPASGPINVVREDPKQPGLLFAGSERAVYFSVDDGDSWQELRMNMPATSIRDLVVHEDDLVIGTHGRAIWIMDNLSPLRELAEVSGSSAPHLFSPALATRVRWNMFSDTPLPPEEPTGENPPDGTTLDYYLPADAREVRIEILDEDGGVVRAYSSSDTPERLDPVMMRHPTYWIRPERLPGTTPGHHRVVWDLRYAPPPGIQRGYDIAATYRNTPSDPVGPFVHPGRYTVRLSVDGAVQEKPLAVRLDPRVEISDRDLELNTRYSMQVYTANAEAQALRDRIDAELSSATGSKRERLAALRGEGDAENPNIHYGSITEVPADEESLVSLQEKFVYLLKVLQSADARPTDAAMASADALTERLDALEQRYAKIVD